MALICKLFLGEDLNDHVKKDKNEYERVHWRHNIGNKKDLH